MLKLNIKKGLITVSILLLLIILLVNIFKKKNYEVEYDIDDYTIIESYDKEQGLYIFTIKDGDYRYSFLSDAKYSRKHKLITGIKEYETEEEKCIEVKSNTVSYNYLCHNSKEEIDYRLTSEEMLEQLDYELKDEESYEFNNKEIFNTLDYTFLIWNYKGFDYINKDETKTIDVTSSDKYEIPLTIVLDKYLVMADYDDKYSFNTFHIIDLKKGTVKDMKTKYDISFDSYILGTKDYSIYLVDNKNKVEYELVPKKKKIRIVGTSKKKGTIYTKKGFESISLTKLVNENESFYDDSNYTYEIEDGKLYQYIEKSKLLVSNKEIKDIVYKKDDTILYLVDDVLYLYNNKYGETKIMSNFEWNFNYKNLIHLYIP